MSAHLPECSYTSGIWYSLDEDCICERLRACEKRVLLSKPNIELSAVYGYEAGLSDGLDAAWFAVGELPFFELPTAAYADYARDQALAAIDALREEKK